MAVKQSCKSLYSLLQKHIQDTPAHGITARSYEGAWCSEHSPLLLWLPSPSTRTTVITKRTCASPVEVGITDSRKSQGPQSDCVVRSKEHATQDQSALPCTGHGCRQKLSPGAPDSSASAGTPESGSGPRGLNGSHSTPFPEPRALICYLSSGKD